MSSAGLNRRPDRYNKVGVSFNKSGHWRQAFLASVFLVFQYATSVYFVIKDFFDILGLKPMHTFYKFLAAVFLISGSVDALAYLDPGTGSLILQGIIAGLAVAGFTIKTYWYKLKAMFGKSQPCDLLEEDGLDFRKEEEQT